MQVSTAAIICIIIAMLLGIIVPIAMLLFLRKRTGLSTKAFWVGCIVMFLFALTLESLLHQAVYSSVIGQKIWNDVWLYAIYGGIMAGLFEETGRFLAFKFILKREQESDGNALLYAAGHGGFEMFAILFFAMLNNLTYAMVMNHPAKMAQVFEHSTPEQAEQIRQVYQLLAVTPAWNYLLAIAERGAAILLQFGLTTFVWFAVKKGGKKLWLLAVAFLLHAFSDASTILVNEFTNNAVLTEGYVWVMALIVSAAAWMLWKKETKTIEEN